MGEHKNPKGWPCVGKYVGSVSDIVTYPWPMHDDADRQSWQSRRVYQDELNYFNGKRVNNMDDFVEARYVNNWKERIKCAYLCIIGRIVCVGIIIDKRKMYNEKSHPPRST